VQEALSVASYPIALNQNQYHIGMGSANEKLLHDKAYALFPLLSFSAKPCFSTFLFRQTPDSALPSNIPVHIRVLQQPLIPVRIHV
jgi:hypothetical protein